MKKKILTETQVEKLFQMDERALRNLRSKGGLPFIQVDGYRRLYYEHRLFEWLDMRERNLGTDMAGGGLSTDTDSHGGDTDSHGGDTWEESGEDPISV